MKKIGVNRQSSIVNRQSSIVNPQSLRWYIVQTKPKKEQVAALNLEHESIEVFFPRMEGISIIYPRFRIRNEKLSDVKKLAF